MNKISALISVGCIAFFSSCGKKSGDLHHADPSVQARLSHAKHFDIPVPLSFSLASSASQKKSAGPSDFMQYAGSLSVSETISFYKREMERAGWDINDLSSNQEGFLYCTKPTKQCGIEIRTSGKPQYQRATFVCLFVACKA